MKWDEGEGPSLSRDGLRAFEAGDPEWSICVCALVYLCLRKTQIIDYEISYTWAGSLPKKSGRGTAKSVQRSKVGQKSAAQTKEPCGQAAERACQDRQKQMGFKTDRQKLFLISHLLASMS